MKIIRLLTKCFTDYISGKVQNRFIRLSYSNKMRYKKKFECKILECFGSDTLCFQSSLILNNPRLFHTLIFRSITYSHFHIFFLKKFEKLGHQQSVDLERAPFSCWSSSTAIYDLTSLSPRACCTRAII